MTSNSHTHCIPAILTALLLFLPAGIAFGMENEEDAPSPRAILSGPYIQNVSEDGLAICWATDEPANTTVFYGKDGTFPCSASDEALTTFHEVHLTGLEANTTYSYYISSNSTRSAASRFKTAPAGRAPFRFAVYGDCRTNHQNHTGIIRQMRSFNPEFYLCTGDLVEAGSSASDWDKFFGIISHFSNDTAYWPSPGNHDLPPDLYRQRFSLPGNELYYSFDWGTAHFIALDTTDDLGNGSAQNDWLRADLEASNATAEWKFVFFHHSPYSSMGHGSNLTVRNTLDPVFERYGVDAVFAGHDHDYEHADPRNGIQYFVTGGGGAPLSPSFHSWFTVYSESAYHFLIVDVEQYNATITAIRENGTVMETVELGRPGPAGPPADFRIVNATASSLALSWEAPTDPFLVGYSIFMNSSGEGGYRRIAALGLVTGYMVEGLAPNTTYRFWMNAAYNNPFMHAAAGYSSNATPPVSGRTLPSMGHHPPHVTLASPAPGNSYEYGQPVNCSATILDGGTGDLPVIEWRLDGVLLADTGANISLWSIPAGNHTLNVKVTDGLGDFGESSVTITVRERPRPPPEPPGEGGAGLPPPLVLAAAALLVLAGAAVLLVLARRAKR